MKKKVVGYLALILAITAVVLLLIVNGTVFVHTKRENIEKCEVTMV